MNTGIPVDNPSGSGTVVLSFNYDSTSVIPWVDFEKVLDAKWFSSDIVGAQVVDDNEHSWRIIKVGEDYYDLWYEETIWNNQFHSSYYKSQSYCYWVNSQLRTNLNGSLFYNNTDKLPTNMKNRVIDKEVNAAWIKYNGSLVAGGTNKSTDKVWLLTVTEIGGKTVFPTLNDWWGDTSPITALNSSGNDGDPYDYFLDDVNKRKSTGYSGLVRGFYNYMWLATGRWNVIHSDAYALYVDVDGSFNSDYVGNSYGVVPAIRVS